MKIAICDDEKMETTFLTELLQSYYENECEIDFFYSGKKLLESGKHYEIYFLDIDIRDMSGITVAEEIRKEDVRAFIVFVTNYGDFFQRAFTVHAFEYMMKPIEKDRLYKILNEICRYQEEDCQNKELSFKGVQGIVRVKVGNICYFEFMDRRRLLELEEWEREEINAEDQSKFLKDRKIEGIELKNVCFSYGSKRVLEGLDLCFNSPGLYTILGENGSGKTTILKLIERLYDSTGGEILINQRDIKEYNLSNLRTGLAYMAKEPYFARDTVLNNLMIGTSGVTEDEAVETCRRVGIHNDIMKLPDKYQTVVEPQGRNFSSGQKQKLGFARLLLQGASVFLLDEVTSDLDDISRKRVWQIILELAEEHIVINVMHYGEYIESSREIFTISEGKAKRVG